MTLQEIQNNMTEILKEYLKDTVVLEKYFFLDKEYFFEYQKLSYNFFPLSNLEKKEINTLSEEIFKNFEFKLIMDSFKNESKLKNLNETSNKQLKTAIAEYILYYLLKKKNIKNFEIQKFNFLYVYISYLFNNSSLEILKLLEEDFELYILSSSAKNLITKLEEDRKVYTTDDNINFLERYNKLYTKKEFTHQLNFYYQIDENKSKIFQDLLGVYSLPSKNMELFYRGQPNSRYDINASLSRSNKLSYFEDELYYEILSLKPLYFKEDKSVYENLITMQHFGLPTRLIDLSRNALISLYFACSGEEKKDGAVYVIPALKDKILNFDDKRLNCLNDLIKKSYKGIKKIEDYCEDCTLKDKASCKNGEILRKSYIVKGLAKNERITNQSGDFIFVGIDEKSKCAKNINPDDIKVEKILIIDSDSKEMILQELKQFNIHTGTVYPDLQNMSSHLKNEFEKRDLPPKIEEKEKNENTMTEKKEYKSSDLLELEFSIFDYKNLNINKLYDNLYSTFLEKNIDKNFIVSLLSEYINDSDRKKIDIKIEEYFSTNKVKVLEKKPYRNLIRKLTDILDFIIILSDYKKEIVITEKTFEWKEYFENPNAIKFPVYNNNEWAMFKMEILQINENGLIGYIRDGQKVSINFDRFVSFKNAKEYGELVAVFDYSNEPLLEIL